MHNDVLAYSPAPLLSPRSDEKQPEHTSTSSTSSQWEMIYLGLGILVASLSFLVYKNRWSPSSIVSTPQGGKEGTEDQSQDEQQAQETVRQEDSNRETKRLNTSQQAQNDGFYAETDEAGSTQTTPKATPIRATDSFPVPSFTLSNGAKPENPNGLGTSESVKVITPRKSISPSPSLDPKHSQHNTQLSMPPPPPPVTTSKRKPQPRASTQMPPPPRPASNSTTLRSIPTTSSKLRPPPSAASTLRTPPNRSLAPSTSTLPPTSRPSRKILLPPGHSPLDWAHLLAHPPTPTFFRGSSLPTHLIRVSPSMLRHHNGRKGRDAWGTWQGKVYNLNPYLKFHPGGEGELMRGAGKEGVAERLFLEVHPWVNWEGMLAECLVGILVGEEDGVDGRKAGEGELEEMD